MTTHNFYATGQSSRNKNDLSCEISMQSDECSQNNCVLVWERARIKNRSREWLIKHVRVIRCLDVTTLAWLNAA